MGEDIGYDVRISNDLSGFNYRKLYVLLNLEKYFQ